MIHYFPEDFTFEEPCAFTDPFRYIPHPAILEAAKSIIKRIDSDPSLAAEMKEGKMIGVMAARSAKGRPCYIAAFSGNVGGQSSISGFVPPIYDLLKPDGEFKRKEAEITAINIKIKDLEDSRHYTELHERLSKTEHNKQTEIEQMCSAMAVSKKRRSELRAQSDDKSVLDQLIRESQFEKAELRRLKLAWDDKISEIRSELDAISREISTLKKKRASMSENLQDWIFRQYIVHNSLGEESSIADIFYAQGIVPPGGTGECAAPKLLEYAYLSGLQPLAMGEFWYGKSPETAVRTHGHFYPSCTSKCGPLLSYMMKGLRVDQHSPKALSSPVVIFEDDAIMIVEKPSGMPSVPGLDGRTSLLEWLRTSRYGSHDIIPVHRLDMDTSGVMIFAKTDVAAVHLQRQFEEHTVRKTYMARISAPDDFRKSIGPETVLPPWPQGEGPATKSWEGLFPDQCFSGAITLPLSPDYDERPRQKVDFQQGKPSHTDYKVVNENPDGTTDLLLYPRTGRTHQLRIHCAHTLGLGRPILGDLLYGGWSAHPTSSSASDSASTLTSDTASHPTHRLHLHALSITFKHPTTGEELTFTSRELCY